MRPIYWPFLPESATTVMVTNSIYISIIPSTSTSSHPTIRKSFPCSPLSVYLSTYLSACLFIHPSISVSPFLNLSLSPHTTHGHHTSIRVSISIYLSVYMCFKKNNEFILILSIPAQPEGWVLSNFPSFHVGNSLLQHWEIGVSLSSVYLLICSVNVLVCSVLPMFSLHWQPPPSTASSGQTGKRRKRVDHIPMLPSVLPGKEAFSFPSTPI